MSLKQARSSPNVFAPNHDHNRPLPPNMRKVHNFYQRPLPPSKPSPKIKPLPPVNIISKSKSTNSQIVYPQSIFNHQTSHNLPSLELSELSKPKIQFNTSVSRKKKIVFIDPLIDDHVLQKAKTAKFKSNSLGQIDKINKISTEEDEKKQKQEKTPKSPPRERASSFHIKKIKKTKKKYRKKHRKTYDDNDRKMYDEAHFVEAEHSKLHWVRRDLIGVGSFGKVYKGYDKNTGEMCAIKQIPFDPNTLQNKNGSKSRLTLIEREVSIMKQLKHENIVAFYDYECSVKFRTLCIVMEFVDGNSIDCIYNQSGAFNEANIRKYTRQIMCGLQFAHKRKIIHRDIKGGNILISKDGMIKIADFGSAKLCDTTFGQSHRLEPSMDYQYTPLWTAPEVLISLGYNDKVDIWSVGCVLIEMATANKPWHECQFESVFAALYHIGQPDNYPLYPSTLSQQCKDFIKLCLNRDASKRCSATELLRHKFLDLNRK